MKDKIFYIICFSLIFIFGILKVSFFPKTLPENFEIKTDEKVFLIGSITDEPEIRENNQKLVIKVSKLNKEKVNEKIKILITTNLNNDYRYGDIVLIDGFLHKPKNFITDTGKEFDYINYLKKDDIFYVLQYPKISILEKEKDGNFLKRKLIFFKQKFLEKVNFAIFEPESFLMGGLILGEKASFSFEQRQKFIDTGTIHIVALSGYNITIVSEWFIKIFSFLPQSFAFGSGIFSIIIFIIMTGSSSTAIRAGIMAIIALIARYFGRTYNISRALVLAGTIMVISNPYVFLYDVSFQLSFIATIALIYLSPKFEKYFLWVTKKFGLRDIFSVTFSVYIFVLPFILYKMGTFSLVSLPTNILILPFIPITMFLGFFTGFIGIFSPFLSLFFGYLSHILLSYELWIIDIFASLPFSSFSVSNFPLIFTIIIYIYFMYKFFGKDLLKFFINKN